jgi:LPXTG-motif cell wall-anchored protein
MKSLASALVFIGIAVLVYGVINYGGNRTTIEMGSMSASITENETASMTAIIVGGLALIGGVVLLAKKRRRV